ncbi:MAG TPA: STAS domain-containing protein [Pseudonocardiaceae bacterium]|nr:STAS domain-containing protein [Pseudonocardiaceae bacterium]
MTTHVVEAGKALTITPMTDSAGLCLVGDIDLATAAALAAALDDLVQGDGDIHLDLAELQFVDLSGASVMVSAATRLGPDRAIVLHNPPPVLSQMLQRFWPAAAGILVDVS